MTGANTSVASDFVGIRAIAEAVPGGLEVVGRVTLGRAARVGSRGV